jgi:hypothetical protein
MSTSNAAFFENLLLCWVSQNPWGLKLRRSLAFWYRSQGKYYKTWFQFEYKFDVTKVSMKLNTEIDRPLHVYMNLSNIVLFIL